MKSKLVYWSITVAIAGFLFGFDTVVISGANQPIKALWNTTPLFHGFFIMSMALWGTVIGALFAGIPSQRLGRKNTLIWIGLLFFISAIGSAIAWDPYSFSVFRFIGGLGVGASSVAAPVYISEISTEKNRGQLVALYQFNIVLGIFVAFFSNYLLKGFDGGNDWRWMLGVEAIPALVYTLMVLGVPKSPRWLLLTKGDEAGAKDILSRIGIADVGAEIAAIKNSVKSTVRENIFVRKYRTPVVLAFLLAFFNQLSGINFVLYYAPEILEKAGLAAKESLQNSIAIGGINLVFTLIGMYLIDRMGRKQLMIIGSLGYIISLGMVSYAYYSGASSTFLMTFLLAFIASHAIGQGAVIWVFISEIFPTKVRAFGQAWGSGIHWIFAALITLLGPVVIDLFSDNPWPIFAVFSGMMVLQLLFVLTMMPETKGVPLEELERRLIKE
ncbi:MAG: sugar porter family MFS transporter [Saprospiraceae bacterium]|nr:sugar porter family MFS transporter [Saprospiraceae bacterium]